MAGGWGLDGRVWKNRRRMTSSRNLRRIDAWVAASATRFRALVATVAVLSLVIASSGAYIVTQRSKATPVSTTDVLADFRTSSEAGADGSVPIGEPASSSPADSPVVPPDAAGPAPEAAVTQDAGRPGGGPPASTAPPAGPDPSATTSSVATLPSAAGPAEGVYTYAAQGYETVSIGNGRHDYPDEVPASIRRTQCGFRLEVYVLEEHTDIDEFCADAGGLSLASSLKTVTFYGQTDTGGWSCETPVMLLPLDGSAPPQGVCRSESSDAVGPVTLVGREELRIDGQAVAVTRVRWEAETDRRTEGWLRLEFWFDASGLPVRIEREAATTSQTPLGTTDYYEIAAYQLVSLTPQR